MATTLPEIARAAGLTHDQAKAVFEAIRARVARGETVTISGFGRFERGIHKGRAFKTPIIEGPVRFPDSYVCRFRSSDVFKEQINRKKPPTPKKAKVPTKNQAKGKKSNGTKQRK